MILPALKKTHLDILKHFIVFHVVYLLERIELFYLFLVISFFFAQTKFPFAEAFTVIKWGVLLAFVAVHLITIGLRIKDKDVITSKIFWSLGIFIFYLFINSLLSINIVVSISRTLILLVSFVLWFFILPNYFRKKEQILKLFNYLFYFFAVVLVLNIALTILVPSVFFRIGIYIRYAGITENANTLGMYSVASVIFILYKFKTGSRFEKVLSVLMFLLVLINFILTVSRSSMLAAFVIIIIFTYYYYRKLFYTGIVLGAMAIGILFMFPILLDLLRLASNPLSYREQLFELAILKWKEDIFFGQGYGTTLIITSKLFTLLQKGFNLLIVGKHFGNMFIELLCETGIIGVALFLPIIGMLYKQQKELNKIVSGDLKILTVLYKGLFFGFLIQNLFESALLAPGNGVAFLFWSFSGLLLSIKYISPVENKPKTV